MECGVHDDEGPLWNFILFGILMVHLSTCHVRGRFLPQNSLEDYYLGLESMSHPLPISYLI